MAGGKNPSTTHRVRTISTLTQEQVQRKRDTDRKAQRALRQRTNSRIQALEEQLAVLKAERSQADHITAAKISSLRQINEDLRRRLGSVGAMVGDVSLSEVDRDQGIRGYVNTGDFSASLSPNIENPSPAEEGVSSHVLTDSHCPSLQQESHPYIPEDHVQYSLQPLEREGSHVMAGLTTPAESWSFSEHPEAAAEKGFHPCSICLERS